MTIADALAAQGWQPIATAPKDGTRILGCWADDGAYTIIEWFEYSGAGYEGTWCQRAPGLGSDCGYSDAAFTHWIHLPPPPGPPSHEHPPRGATLTERLLPGLAALFGKTAT